MGDFPKIISVDDHVIEPAHVWQDRLPAKYKDIGPRVKRAPMGEMKFVGGKFSYVPGGDGAARATGGTTRTRPSPRPACRPPSASTATT